MSWRVFAKRPDVTAPFSIAAILASQLRGLGYPKRGFAPAVVFGKAGLAEAGRMPWHTSWHRWGPLRALRERGGGPSKLAMRHSWAMLWSVLLDGELSSPADPDRRRSWNESRTRSSIPTISAKVGCSTHRRSSPPRGKPSRRLSRPPTMSSKSLVG